MKKRLIVSVTTVCIVAVATMSWGFILPEWAPEDWTGELMGWATPPVIDGDISEWQAQDAVPGLHTFTLEGEFLTRFILRLDDPIRVLQKNVAHLQFLLENLAERFENLALLHA